MMRSPLHSFAVVIAAAAVGIGAGVHSWGGRVFITRAGSVLTSDRIPASIRKQANISELDGDALRLAAQRRLLEDMKVLLETDRVGIQLGHFLTRNEDGQAADACDVYKQIILNFEGEGIADSGDKPVMQVTAPCAEAVESDKMQPIWIPLSELRARAPSNVEIAAADQQTHVKFMNIGAEWPSQWALQSVHLAREEAASSSADLSIGGDELHGLIKKPVIIRW